MEMFYFWITAGVSLLESPLKQQSDCVWWPQRPLLAKTQDGSLRLVSAEVTIAGTHNIMYFMCTVLVFLFSLFYCQWLFINCQTVYCILKKINK